MIAIPNVSFCFIVFSFLTYYHPLTKMAFEHSAVKKLRRESESNDENSNSSSGSVFTEHSPSTDSSDFSQKPHLERHDSVDLPHNLSKWEKRHLEQLNFRISFGLTPIELITKNHDDLADFEKMMLQMKLELIEKSNFTRFLNRLENTFSSFDNFVIDEPDLEWEMYLDDKFSFAPKPVEVPDDLKLWFSSFHSFAKEFTHRLYDILLRKEEKCPIYESHFQFLFSSFVSAFGLLCGSSFAPCLDNQMLTIGDYEVVGVPDIVFSCKSRSPAQATEPRKSRNRIVAVCEVKKDPPKLEEKSSSPPSSKTRGRTNPKRSSEGEVVSSSNEATSSTTELDGNRKMFNWKISDKLIGQHGGELLFNFPKSFRSNIVMGMVVQQTQVSFTTLDMTQKTFERILSGEWKHKQDLRPVMTVTRPYDIFKKEERKQLIEPFIKFAVFQKRYLY